jgi:hypothetical protein
MDIDVEGNEAIAFRKICPDSARASIAGVGT